MSARFANVRVALELIGLTIAAVATLPYVVQQSDPGPSAISIQLAAMAEAAAANEAIMRGAATPSGEVSAAVLLGRNEQNLQLIRWPTGWVNERGEPLDPWGQPFHIVLRSERQEVEVRSAGMNGRFGDQDDQVAVRHLRVQKTEQNFASKTPN